jgi:hypothetical protein
MAGLAKKMPPMAAGSIVGSFIGGRLLGLVPTPVLLPLAILGRARRLQRIHHQICVISCPDIGTGLGWARLQYE